MSHIMPVLWCEQWPQIWERQTLTMSGLCWGLLKRMRLMHWQPSFRRVCWHKKKREREYEEEREEDEGGERREKESLAHFLFSSWMLTFFSGLCTFLSPSCLWMWWWCGKAGAFVCERVWRMSALEREREKKRERTKERRRERERERRRKREGEGELSLFYSHFLLFRARYASLHNCFLTQSDDVATFFPSSSLSHSLSHSLSNSFNSQTQSHTLSLSLSLSYLSLSFLLTMEAYTCTPHTHALSLFIDLSIYFTLPSLCVYHFLCLILNTCDVWHIFQWVSASFIDDLSMHGKNGPKQKNEDSEERKLKR